METPIKLSILPSPDGKTFMVEISDQRYPFALAAGSNSDHSPVLPAKDWKRADVSQASLSRTFPSTYEGLCQAREWSRTVLSLIAREETAWQPMAKQSLEGCASSLLAQLHCLFA
ncbi:MAG: hypothetical protein D6690_14705 [Nitrospirae bacterium]|nr:MAG: hypothetical protein D6690_14705 [Nitrospirota bacterium]